MRTWIRPLDNSGTITGVNDGSIYTFKERKYESLAREVLQNSIDERLFDDLSVKVEFQTFILPTHLIPGVNEYLNIFKDSLEYWKSDKQDNGRLFFSQAIELLNSGKIRILRISDFNTNGVIGSQKRDIKSSGDITPWYNLIKSEGSSSKGSTQGGSFGIGKNATFANSILRTVFYSTLDKEDIEAYEGIAKLATVYRDDKQLSPKPFYGVEDNGISQAVGELLNLDPGFKREEYGTDIFVLGFEIEEDWILRIVSSVLSDFFLPIQNNNLEVIIEGESINSHSLEAVYMKYIDEANKYGSTTIRNSLQNSYNYYCISKREETLLFEKDFSDYGKAKLKVLYNPDFDRQVMRTRETGMKLFSRGSISQTVGFSGIVSLEGSELNRIFRKMENPAHTAWSVDNIDDPNDKKAARSMLKELDKWIKDTITENAYDTELEYQEVEGLGEYLPAFMTEKSKDKSSQQEVISSKIAEITEYKPDRDDEKKKRKVDNETEMGGFDPDGVQGLLNTPSDNKSKSKGGIGTPEDRNIVDTGNAIISRKVDVDNFRVRAIADKRGYLIVVKPLNDISNASLEVKISGETSSERFIPDYIWNKDTGEVFEIQGSRIQLGNLATNDKLPLIVEAKDIKNFALEVELYEN
jgi:hypothetical protein